MSRVGGGLVLNTVTDDDFLMSHSCLCLANPGQKGPICLVRSSSRKCLYLFFYVSVSYIYNVIMTKDH